MYTGTTNSCHRVGVSVVDTDNFDNFHNTDKKVSDRKLMLAGEWPTGGCEYCKNMENVGGISDRMMHLHIPNLTPPELDSDLTEVNVTPRIVEVYLDNVCNMSCVYCNDGFSSRIQKENQKYGRFESDGVIIENLNPPHPQKEQLKISFWKWMENNYHHLHRLHILGGEPFFQSEFETCLEFLESHSNRELEFNVVTNLKVSPAKLANFVQRIRKMLIQKKIKRLDITCSIDCWGDAQEYIRFGINLNQWKQNFEYLVAQKWITLNINQTITGLGMKDTVPLIQYVNTQRAARKIGHYHMAVVNPSYFSPIIFGAGVFDNDFQEILKVMPDDTQQHQLSRQLMKSLQMKCAQSTPQLNQLMKLRVALEELDRRRNINWRSTFPWLEKELQHVV